MLKSFFERKPTAELAVNATGWHSRRTAKVLFELKGLVLQTCCSPFEYHTKQDDRFMQKSLKTYVRNVTFDRRIKFGECCIEMLWLTSVRK